MFTVGSAGTYTYRVAGYMEHGWEADTETWGSASVHAMFFPQ
jgi:hypothetical protein